MNGMKSLFKISPVFLIAGLMIGGVDALLAAPAATLYAAIVAMLTEKMGFNDLLETSVQNVKELNLVFFILMMAYAMAEVFMASGVGASIIIMALNLGVTGKTIAVVGFFVTSILSVATGTSWGTFAACAPIFLWLNHIVGGNLLLTCAAIAGGACFGDNIGLISDTTVVSSGIQKVEVIDRIRHQGVWALLSLVAAGVIFFFMGLGLPGDTASASEAINQITPDVMNYLQAERPSSVVLLNQVKQGVPLYMIIPLLLVLVAAIKGLPTIACLGIGIIASFGLGSVAGTIKSLGTFSELVMAGFKDAGSWVIVMMMWIGAFGGIMSKIKAFDPLSKLVLRMVRNVRQLMFANGILSILGNAALADEMAQIVTIGPIIKDLTDQNVEASEEDMYKLRLRNATFGSSLGVFGSQLVPWHVYIGFYVGIASAVYPLHTFVAMDIIKYNFMAMISVASILIFTLTGLDRLIPGFGLPSEPAVKLRKSNSYAESKIS
ncbi:Na+/H+ antiporter NhaC family protein [Inediibacterium massiliense]|uniref:Na+/H+ antiporter NhaC family protein n=1 Tax=Inediibacterium massiliense TaxID=1658111 RepID=UPI000B0A14E9|nr:Na+/H+ antiporter NhaC family protein [Inediibacterium massiliense]